MVLEYKTLTVGELIKDLKEMSKEYIGDETPVYTGDLEGNYTHGKHELMYDSEHQAIFIGYEMHESIDEW